jgi:signal transduction histidine kinase
MSDKGADMKKGRGRSKTDRGAELVELKRFVDEVVHDLASPLSFLDVYINGRAAPSKRMAVSDRDIDEIARRSFSKVRDMVDELRAHADADEHSPASVDLVTIVMHSMREVGARLQAFGVEMSYDGPRHLIGSFDEGKVARAVTNLIANAVDAMENAKGRIAVRVGYDDQSVWIDVEDDGAGFPLSIEGRIFDQGFSFGKRNGSGIGLSLCERVVAEHGGSVSAYNKGRGSIFTMTFPRRCGMLVCEEGSSPLVVGGVDDEMEELISSACAASGSVRFCIDNGRPSSKRKLSGEDTIEKMK